MKGAQLSREDSNFKSVSAKGKKGRQKRPIFLKIWVDEKGEEILETFKIVAERKFFGKKGWFTNALFEAMKLYVWKYGRKCVKMQRKKIKINSQTKRVLRDFFAYILSFYRCLQPGLKRSLIYHFLDEIGVLEESTKYRYLRKMIDLGLVSYAYTDFDKELIYHIEWDEIFRLFPELKRPGLRRVDW